jgi:spore coat protein CotH
MKLSVVGPLLVFLFATPDPGPCTEQHVPPTQSMPRPVASPKAVRSVPGSALFDEPTVLDFQVRLAATNLQALRDHPRDYARATVLVNGAEFQGVGVRLKGSVGSYRPVDDYPALTLNFSKWSKGQRLFGLRRLHLNNSVQDDSRMNEYIASGLFRQAGVPTPRVAWATVRLNNRKLGLYVLKEGFAPEFLQIFFGSAKGNLYDGGFKQDIDRSLAKESGAGPDDRSDLRAIYSAIEDKDVTNRWAKLNQLVDVDLFVTYAALSVMLVDWDGYALGQNNYRVYFRPSDGRAVFLPHGMDQLFQRSNYDLDAGWSGSVASAIFDTPQGQALYRERCRQVFTNVFKLEQMTNTIARLTGILQQADTNVVSSASDLSWRIQRRFRELRHDELLKPPPANR